MKPISLSPRRPLVPAVALFLALAGGMTACSGEDGGSASGTTTSTTKAAAGAEQVVAQLADLPDGFRKCAWAGEITAYMEHFKAVGQQRYDSLVATWRRLQAAGATDGYFASYGNTRAACESMQNGAGEHDDALHDPDDPAKHPTTVFSFVTHYKDEASAAEVYRTDVFGQSKINPRTYSIQVGEPTGLGPNSTVATQASANPVRQAVWQRNAYTVYFGSENLQPPESQKVLTAVDERIA